MESLTKLLPDLHQNALLKFMAFLNAGSFSLPNSWERGSNANLLFILFNMASKMGTFRIA